MLLNSSPEFLGVGDQKKRFRCAASSPNNDASVTENSAQYGLFHADAFHAGEHQVECAAAGQARFDQYAFAGDSHFRGIAFCQSVDKDRGSSHQEEESDNRQSPRAEFRFAERGILPGTARDRFREESEARYSQKQTEEKWAEQDDPVMARLIEQRFPGHEIIFRVTQSSPRA